MKKKQVWRYYCDYCKKGGCSGGHMKRHEASCTMNPDRICRMCDAADLCHHEMSTLLDTLEGCTVETIPEHLEALSDAAEDCPACMLAAIRQKNLTTVLHSISKDYEHPMIGHEHFSFKEKRDAFWAIVNDGNRIDIAY